MHLEQYGAPHIGQTTSQPVFE